MSHSHVPAAGLARVVELADEARAEAMGRDGVVSALTIARDGADAATRAAGIDTRFGCDGLFYHQLDDVAENLRFAIREADDDNDILVPARNALQLIVAELERDSR